MGGLVCRHDHGHLEVRDQIILPPRLSEALGTLMLAQDAQARGLEDDVIDRIYKLYSRMSREMSSDLTDRIATGTGIRFTELHNDLMLDQINRALVVLEPVASAALEIGAAVAAPMAQAQQMTYLLLAEDVAGTATEVVEQIMAVRPVVPTQAVANAFKAYPQYFKKYSEDAYDAMREGFAESIARGESVREAARRIKPVLADAPKYKVERIVRTEINRAMNTTHESTIEQVAATLPPSLGLKRQWSSHLDDRTSAICIALNGVVVEIGVPFGHGGITFQNPPAHPNCRSRVNAYRASWGGKPARASSEDPA